MRYGYYFLSRTGVKLFSGVPESLPTPSARFRAFSKVSPHRRHVFGRSRKSPDIAGTFSGVPESLPTSLAQFRGIPKNKKLKMGRLHPFTFSPFHLFTFSPFHLFTLSPLHPFTFSPLHPFTLSPFHLFTFITTYITTGAPISGVTALRGIMPEEPGR